MLAQNWPEACLYVFRLYVFRCAPSGHQTMFSSLGGSTLANQSWFPELIQLSLTAPWPILLMKELFSQPLQLPVRVASTIAEARAPSTSASIS